MGDPRSGDTRAVTARPTPHESTAFAERPVRRDYEGALVDVVFSAADTQADIRHGLGVVPDGFELVMWDCVVRATPGAQWTTELAYLQSDRANGRIKVLFYTLREPVDDR